MGRLFWIALGGAAGTLARYGLSNWCHQTLGLGFPYGTLAVNVAGSFLLGVVLQVGLTTGQLSPTLRLALGTGVMGGFTTYSTFNYETLKLLEERSYGVALLNVTVTLLGCLVAGVLGITLARRFA